MTTLRRSFPMMTGHQAMQILAERRTNEIVVSTMTATRFWNQYSQRPELDLPLYGAMGKASSIGLGLALARPDRRVIVIDGDGSLLMNLGSLVTIAGATPENLVHVVFHNTVYQTTGGQPVPGVGKYNFAALARGAGYRHAHSCDDPEMFRRELPMILKEPGPTLIDLLVVTAGSELPPSPTRRTAEAWPEVKAALAAGR